MWYINMRWSKALIHIKTEVNGKVRYNATGSPITKTQEKFPRSPGRKVGGTLVTGIVAGDICVFWTNWLSSQRHPRMSLVTALCPISRTNVLLSVTALESF